MYITALKNKIYVFAAAVLVVFLLTANACASAQTDLTERIQAESAGEFLEQNGVDLSEPTTIKNISANSFFGYFISVFKSSLQKPAKIFLIVLTLSLISEAAVTLSMRQEMGKEVFALICFLIISPMLVSSFSEMTSAMKSQQTFIASYLPAFAAITAASGNPAGAATYNALVLYAAEGVTFLSGFVLKPIIACMLVMSCTQAINPDLSDLTGSLKRILTTLLGAAMTVFVGVIGLQTAVGRTGNEIVLKTGKYLVSSFVPVIGMSLSESYKTVKMSLGAMRSALGSIGIVVIVIILAKPIITMCTYRLMFLLLDWSCRLTGSKMLSQMMSGLADVYSMCATLLTIYALMFLISTGIMIMIGSEAYI